MKLSMTMSGPRLRRPLDLVPRAERGVSWEMGYGISSLLQISPTEVALVVNRRVTNMSVVDFEDGADLVVFDALEGIRAEEAVPLMRTQVVTQLGTGQDVFMVAHMSTGGFVPMGAKLADGSAHPAAGTGFVLGGYKGHPCDSSRGHSAKDDCHYWAARYELVQLRYDGGRVRVVDRLSMAAPEGLLAGHHFMWYALSSALPDGADLLSGLTLGPVAPGERPGASMIPTVHPHGHAMLGRNFGAGLCRWRYDEQGWRPAEFVPVTGPDMAFEPSLVRDKDGALLMSVRGKGLKDPPGSVQDGLENTFEHFRVYRSTDDGRSWRKAIHLPRRRNATPVILNRTPGGGAYLAANPYEEGKDSRGRKIPSTSQRRSLCLWPLNANCDGVEEPVCVLDAAQRFGPPRPIENLSMSHDNLWMVDHPMGNVCRLGDGRWHALQCFRVTDKAVSSGGAGAAEESGAWVEALSYGDETPVPAWQFD